MIINGGSRRNGGFFARHLMRADQNERVAVVEIRGLIAQNVRDAFREMEAVASGTRCKNYFYHANLNTRESEQLTPEQWEHAADTLERELGLIGQPRFVVEHAKEGRTHRHIVWSRIDLDSMTAISDSLTYRKHETAARAIELEFGHEPVPSVLVPNRETERPERNAQDWETFRGQDSKLDPKAIKAEVTALWIAADNGAAFAAALGESGYILTRGDRRDFCIVDKAGDEHSLARRVGGVKAAEIRARMADIDRDALPSVEEGRALARQVFEDEADTASSSLEVETTSPSDTEDAAAPAAETSAAELSSAELPDAAVAADTLPEDLQEATPQTAATPPVEAPEATVADVEGTTPPQAEDASHDVSQPVAGDTIDAQLYDAIDGAGEPDHHLTAQIAIVGSTPPHDEALAAAAASTEPAALPVSDDDGLAMFLPEQPLHRPRSPAFEAVERETLSLAIADQAATHAEVEQQAGGRLGRVRAWWDNMREYVAGWREQVREHASHYLTRWDKEEMQERAAEQAPEQLSPEPPSPELDLTP